MTSKYRVWDFGDKGNIGVTNRIWKNTCLEERFYQGENDRAHYLPVPNNSENLSRFGTFWAYELENNSFNLFDRCRSSHVTIHFLDDHIWDAYQDLSPICIPICSENVGKEVDTDLGNHFFLVGPLLIHLFFT